MRWLGRSTARSVHLVAPLVAGVLLPAASACSQNCGMVDCNTGVAVWWNRADFAADEVELCINNQCEVQNVTRNGDAVSVVPSNATADLDIDVRVMMLDGTGATFSGSGRKDDNECCDHISLNLRSDGTFVKQSQPVPSDGT